MLNRKRFWTIGLALMTALSIMGFGLGTLISAHAQTSSYQDPAGRFQIAVLPSYKMIPAAGMFVVESPEGDVAYTVTVRPKADDRYLDDPDLAQFALAAVEKGEGFTAGVFAGTDIGVEMPWQGMLGKTPIFGTLFARQTNNSVLILTISATDMGAEKIAAMLPELSQSLKPVE